MLGLAVCLTFPGFWPSVEGLLIRRIEAGSTAEEVELLPTRNSDCMAAELDQQIASLTSPGHCSQILSTIAANIKSRQGSHPITKIRLRWGQSKFYDSDGGVLESLLQVRGTKVLRNRIHRGSIHFDDKRGV
jgi:hypothetical protein